LQFWQSSHHPRVTLWSFLDSCVSFAHPFFGQPSSSLSFGGVFVVGISLFNPFTGPPPAACWRGSVPVVFFFVFQVASPVTLVPPFFPNLFCHHCNGWQFSCLRFPLAPPSRRPLLARLPFESRAVHRSLRPGYLSTCQTLFMVVPFFWTCGFVFPAEGIRFVFLHVFFPTPLFSHSVQVGTFFFFFLDLTENLFPLSSNLDIFFDGRSPCRL